MSASTPDFDLVESALKTRLAICQQYAELLNGPDLAIEALQRLRVTDEQIRGFWQTALDQMKAAQNETDAKQKTITIVATLIRKLDCCCPYSNVFSSEEYDRRHASWCPVWMRDAMLKVLA